MEGDRLLGIVDESDVLLHVYGDEARFRDPVSTAMVSKLDKVDVGAPIESLLPVFDRGLVEFWDGDGHQVDDSLRLELKAGTRDSCGTQRRVTAGAFLCPPCFSRR